MVEINNQYYSNIPLNISVGRATSSIGEKMESVAKRADLLMYEDKRSHYSAIKAASGKGE